MKVTRLSAELRPKIINKQDFRRRTENIHEEVSEKRPKSLPYGYRACDMFSDYDGNWLAVKLSCTLTGTENGYIRQGLTLQQVQLLQLERIPPDFVRNFAKAALNMIDGPDPLE